MMTVDIRGLNEVQRQLQNLAAEQIPYATMVAINNTAFAVQKASRARLEAAFDKPTPLIKGATRVEKATKQTLTATVYIDPKRALILETHEEGGKRGHQAIERFLVGKGWLPSGWRAVPGGGMPLDTYGNPKRAEVAKVIAELNAGISGIATSNRRCFVIRPGQRSRLTPGIYRIRSRSQGRSILPLFLFVSTTQYRPILKWEPTVAAEAVRLLPDEAARAIQRALATTR
ncbi:MAG: phage tail protein [Candidatus Contendobacter sp.]|jgi:hypothetical protein|nr:phage tail protein [Candidatus Contendobacter sp.]